MALAVLTALAWTWLLTGPGMMTPTFILIASMWSVMMIAMMTPSAAPTALLYARAQRMANWGKSPPIAPFILGYLIVWIAFSLLAAALQVCLQRMALASPMTMALTGPRAAAAVMIGVGIYQLTPFKDACLSRCRSPAEFLSRHYRPGVAGALRLGLLHGAYCVGCCWLLMALLFVGGVMNLLWVAGLTLLVAGEKLLPHGRVLAHVSGAALIGWGAAQLLI